MGRFGVSFLGELLAFQKTNLVNTKEPVRTLDFSPCENIKYRNKHSVNALLGISFHKNIPTSQCWRALETQVTRAEA